MELLCAITTFHAVHISQLVFDNDNCNKQKYWSLSYKKSSQTKRRFANFFDYSEFDNNFQLHGNSILSKQKIIG